MRTARFPAVLVRFAAVLALAGVAGCGRAPELDTDLALSGTATYPELKPLGDLVAPAGETVLTEEEVAALRARAAALKRRGAALTGTETADAATRARLDAALAAQGG